MDWIWVDRFYVMSVQFRTPCNSPFARSNFRKKSALLRWWTELC